jgi:glycosyltransferase involved in cell wall biosynthesis
LSLLPAVSIVIPAYNAGPALKETIEGCLHQDYPEDKLEVIVVDDGSSDGTSSVVKKYPVIYIYQENRGPASARNRGWRAAKGEIVFFIDSDCVPEREWVKKLVEEYGPEQVGGVGGSYDIRNPRSSLARLIHSEILARHRIMPRETLFLGSFNVSYRHSVLENVGGFDESFRWASGEDNDLSYRVTKAGYKLIFRPDVKVGHLHTERLGKYLKEQYRHGYWRVKLYKLHPDMMSGDDYSSIRDFLPPVLAPLMVLFFVIGIFWHAALYISVALAAVTMGLSAHIVASMVKQGEAAPPQMVGVLFLRAFARGLGMVKGVADFMVKA